MTVTQIIDQVIERSDNIKGSPADYLDRRLRLLDYLREVVDEIWWLRDWPWRLKEGTITVPAAAAKVVVPTDFLEWGHDGGLYGADGNPLDPVTEREILDLRASNYTTDYPDRYALFGIDETGGSPTYRKMIQFPTNLAAVTLSIKYFSTAPDLDETTNVNNLVRIPAAYHRTVVVHGLRMKSRQSKSDARAVESKEEYEKAKRWMLVRESRDANKVRQLPGFFRSRGGA